MTCCHTGVHVEYTRALNEATDSELKHQIIPFWSGFGIRVSLYNSQVARLSIVVKAGFELVILLPQPPRCWDYKHVCVTGPTISTLTLGRLPYSSFILGHTLQRLKTSERVDDRQDWNPVAFFKC